MTKIKWNPPFVKYKVLENRAKRSFWLGVALGVVGFVLQFFSMIGVILMVFALVFLMYSMGLRDADTAIYKTIHPEEPEKEARHD